MKIGQSASSANRAAAQRILTAAFMSLAAAVAGQAPTGAVTLLGLVPPAVANGTAVAAGSFSSSQMLRLVIGLQHPHMAEEEQFLEALHTKGSPEFRHFLTADEWNASFSPSPPDEQSVVDWAQANGLTVTQRFANRLLVDVEAPVSAIESALGVKINSYAIGGRSYYSNDRNPVVPAALGRIVHSVGGLNNIQVMRPGNHGFPEPVFPVYSPGPAYAVGESGSHDGDRTLLPAAKPGFTNGAYDPTDLYSSAAYDTNALDALGHCCNPLNNPNTSPKEASIAIVSAGVISGSDITGFHNQYPYLADHWQQFPIDGTTTTPDGEGTLDVEWSTAMANSFGAVANTAMVYLYEGANTSLSTITDAFNHVLSDGYARVFSTSLGCAEFDCAAQSWMDTVHGIFNSMIGQGWTLVAASGDGGATTGCEAHDAVAYPASDPDMVAAGGSSLQLSLGPIFDAEAAWSGGPSDCANDDGGSGGGFSAYYAAPSYMALPSGSMRPVPDIALNADGFYSPQNFYFNGSLSGAGGTSIVAPEVAGFFAQANAYMLYVGNLTGGCSGAPCAPVGNGDWFLYFFGLEPRLAPHYPFYDITSGCNNNDVTIADHLNFFCAGTGRDQVTGWGSFNFLQLAWAINFLQAGDFGTPSINFTGPALNKWYNTNQIVSWTISDTTGNSKPPTGVAGFSEAWDTQPGGGDPSSEATPGTGNTFYSGPQFPNKTSGCLDFAGTPACSVGSGQGWHTVDVRAWDNTGIPAYSTYGPIGFDTVPPQTTGQASTTNPVQITLTATDASSGIASTVYQLDGGATTTYTAPFPVSALGSHTLTFHSTDNAGNVESTETLNFSVGRKTATAVTSSVNPSQFDQRVTFTAAVSSAKGTPAGTVTFFDGSTQLGVGTLSAGSAAFGPTTLALGSHNITASYTGSANFAASTSSVLTQTAGKAATTTTLIASPDPSKADQLVTFTATVTGAFGGSPNGTVTFKNGTKILGNGTLNASTHKATFTTSSLPEGANLIQAGYAGNVDFNDSVSSVWKQTVSGF
jgi:kumamolisin